MAKIATYPVDAVPTINDKVIGTDVDNELITKNYRIGDIVALVPGGGLSVQSLNTLTGELTLLGTGGITITASGTDLTIDGSGIGGGGITSVDGATGPAIDLAGKGGITITAVGNLINIDGSGISGGSPGGSVSNVQFHGTGGVFEGNQFNTYVLGVQHSNHTLGGKEKAGQVTLDTFGTGDAINYGNAALQHRTGNYVHLAGCTSQEGAEEYYIYFPQKRPNDNEILESNGNGQLTWIPTPSGGGGITQVSGTAPVDVTSGTTPVVSMSAATDKIDGYLSTTVYNTFNNKQDSLVSGTSIKTINGTSILGSGNIIISGGGTPAGSDGQIQFNTNSAFDADTNLNWDTTNNILVVGKETNPTYTQGVIHLKGNGSTEGGKVKFQTGAGKGSPVDIILQAPDSGTAQTIELPDTLPTQATQVLGIKTISGSVISTQWETPTSGGGTVTDVTATLPLSSTQGATPDISISESDANTDGYLSSTNFTAFNGKQAALVSGTNIKSINNQSLLGAGNLTISGGSATPAGAATQVQFHSATGSTFDADTEFTYRLDTVNKIATVTLGNEASPSNSYGVLRLDGDGSAEGGRVEFRTGASKAQAATTITVQAPSVGATQSIALPETLPSATTQVLGLKAISGTNIRTEWVDPPSGGGGVTYIGKSDISSVLPINNNSLELVTLGQNQVWIDNSTFGKVELADESGIQGAGITFTGAGSAGDYWIAVQINFTSQGTAGEMYIDVEGSPNAQKLVDMEILNLPAGGSTAPYTYYRTFRYTKTGADKQTVHVQAFFPAKAGIRGQILPIVSPVVGMADAPSATVEVWKNA